MLLVLVLLPLPVLAERIPGQPDATGIGWSLHLDNDLLVGDHRDRDYTGGMAISQFGSRTLRRFWSPEPIRSRLDSLILPESRIEMAERFSLYSVDFGFVLFTPENISTTAQQPDERPYASLFFLASSRQRVFPQSRSSLHSTLTLGLLGLPLAADIQSGVHTVTGGAKPTGWRNQISAGGELTANYSLALQKTLILGRTANGMGYEFKTTAESNLGYTTDISVGFNGRWGVLSKPWWTFNPHQAEYISLGSPANLIDQRSKQLEAYFYTGGSINYRFYNAFLQGQFRHSDVTFRRSELQPWIAEMWAGVSIELPNHIRFSTFLRMRTAEIDSDDASVPVWGGIAISQAR